jgi:hypothetical protein
VQAPEWRNAVAARMLFALIRYRPRTAASRLTMPLLVSIAEKETAASPTLTADMISRVPKAEVSRYPIGHFDAYTGEWLERIAGDQISFLRAHLGISAAATPERASESYGANRDAVI